MTASLPPWACHLRPEVAAMDHYTAPYMPAPVARLHANECPYPWPDAVYSAIDAAIRRVELNRYPQISGEVVRRLVANEYGCDPDQVVLGNGSDEIISLLLMALAGTHHKPSHIVTPAPTFVMYRHSAQVQGIGVEEVPLTRNFELDPSAMDAALARGPALCFFARPNNPTSSLWSAEIIDDLMARYPATVFVIDEAYGAYAPGTSMWSTEPRPNHLQMGTLSKVGMAALRLGYCIAHPRLACALNVVRHPYNISQTSLAIAETILTQFGEVQADMIRRTIAGRDRLAALLATLPGAEVMPAFANFVVARFAQPGAATRLQNLLRERGILVKDLSRYPGLADCLRVSGGTPPELDLFERALREFPTAAWSES
ncbi:MAG: pyridoxal phosphate-dependent aminotransferase, partial [Nannocystaceae bacterium]